MTDYQQFRGAASFAEACKLAQTKTAVAKSLWRAVRNNPGKSTAVGVGAVGVGAAGGGAALAVPGLVDRGRAAASNAWESTKDLGREIKSTVEENAPELAERAKDTVNAATGESSEAKARRARREAGAQLQHHKDKAGDFLQYAKDNSGLIAARATFSLGTAGLLYWLLNRRRRDQRN